MEGENVNVGGNAQYWRLQENIIMIQNSGCKTDLVSDFEGKKTTICCDISEGINNFPTHGKSNNLH